MWTWVAQLVDRIRRALGGRPITLPGPVTSIGSEEIEMHEGKWQLSAAKSRDVIYWSPSETDVVLTIRTDTDARDVQVLQNGQDQVAGPELVIEGITPAQTQGGQVTPGDFTRTYTLPRVRRIELRMIVNVGPGSVNVMSGDYWISVK